MQEVAIYTEDLETMADVMAEDKNWSWPQTQTGGQRENRILCPKVNDCPSQVG
jgi:hypothetical protein